MSDPSHLPVERRVFYSQVRDSIEDGDIILFRGNKQISQAIAQISRSAYSHAGLVLTWFGRRMLVSAEAPKIQAIPLSIAVTAYDGRVDWYKLEAEARAQLNVQKLALEALTNLGVEYGTTKLFDLAAHFVFGADVPDDEANPRTMICSQFVSRCFRVGGADLSPKSDLATVPGEIAASPLVAYIATLSKDEESADAVRDRQAI